MKMKNNQFKKIRNNYCTCYYFDVIINFKSFDFNNILLDDKLCQNILIYDIFYKTLIGTKYLRIMFSNVDGFITDYVETKYLVLIGREQYDVIYGRNRYVIGPKSGITSVLSHNYIKTKIDSDDDLALEETLTLHNIMILIKSVFKDQNHYCNNTFLGKCSCRLAKK